MIKALFFDIDGTLVSFDTHAIPETTIEAIAAAKAKGIRIFIATGRPAVIINNLSALQDRELIDGYITMNGGYCFVGKEVIYIRVQFLPLTYKSLHVSLLSRISLAFS